MLVDTPALQAVFSEVISRHFARHQHPMSATCEGRVELVWHDDEYSTHHIIYIFANCSSLWCIGTMIYIRDYMHGHCSAVSTLHEKIINEKVGAHYVLTYNKAPVEVGVRIHFTLFSGKEEYGACYRSNHAPCP
jgi:hypothetical protein